MITKVDSKKMVVLSDLHLGNPYSKVRERTIDFLRRSSKDGYDICINGDGFEVAQVSFQRLALELPAVLQELKACTHRGVKVYYVVGNHDILFEHFLHDWGAFVMAPFLNVVSGGRRIRIEHGHLYDPFFIRNPRLYEFSTWFAGFFLRLHPSLYRVWIAWEKWRSYLRMRKGIRGEHPKFAEAATEIASRGFDHIVFGHTHHSGTVEVAGGARYYNPGSWMLEPSYVKIEEGNVELCRYGLGR